MYVAAYHGHADVIQELVLLGSRSVEILNGQGSTPIFAAAQNGHVVAFNVLAQLGCSISANRLGDTALHCAASSGNCEIISALVHMGCTSINTPNTQGYTPMRRAAESGHTKAVELLVQLGCTTMDLVARDLIRSYANKHNCKKHLRLLRLLGVEASRSHANTIYHKYHDIMTEDIDEEKAAEVRQRVYFQRSLSSRLLLAYSRTLDLRASLIIKVEQDGTTVDCHIGLIQAVAQGNREKVVEWIDEHPECIALFNTKCYLNTPVHEAAKRGHVDILSLLYDRGFDIDVENKASNTAMHIAMVYDCRKIVERLICLGSQSLTDFNLRRGSPISIAVALNRRCMVELLARFGCLNYDFSRFTNHDYQSNDDIKCSTVYNIFYAVSSDRNIDLYPVIVREHLLSLDEDDLLAIRRRIYFQRSLSSRLLFQHDSLLARRMIITQKH